MLTLLDFCMDLRDINCAFPMALEGRMRQATNSEIKRLIMNGGLEVNGEIVKDPITPLDGLMPMKSFVVFPNGKRRTILA